MHTKHASRMPGHPYRCNTRILQPLYNVIVHSSSVSLYPILDCFYVFRTVTHYLGATNILAQFFSSLVPKPLASIKRDSHLQRQLILLLKSIWIARNLVRNMSQSVELQNLDGTHSYSSPYSDISGSRRRVRDEQALARLGKKQVLKVRPCEKRSSPGRILSTD